MECFHCKGSIIKVIRHLVQTGMAIIFHGNLFGPEYVQNVESLFLMKMKSIIFKKHYRKLMMKPWC